MYYAEIETSYYFFYRRSLDGTGNFNWRFLFPLLYIPAEKVMVIRKKVSQYFCYENANPQPGRKTL